MNTQTKSRRKLVGGITLLLVLATVVITVIILKKDNDFTVHAGKDAKVVDSAGNSLDVESKNAVNDLLKAIEIAEGFSVYAEEIDQTNHIEGNVCVNKTNEINIVLNRVFEKIESDYSYAGGGDQPIRITDGSKIVLGNSIKVEKPNANQTIINGGYSADITLDQLSEKQTEDKKQEIKANLDKICEASKNLVGKKQTDENAIANVCDMLKNDSVSAGDIVVVNIDCNDFSNKNESFDNLIDNNKGTIVIINVITNGNDDITLNKGFVSGHTTFTKLAPYIIWNFGEYSGNLTFAKEMVGIVVAPKANFFQQEGNLNGGVIASIVSNNGEIHQVTRRNIKIPTQTAKPEVTSSPKVTDKPKDTANPNETADPRGTLSPIVTRDPNDPSNPSGTADPPKGTLSPIATTDPNDPSNPSGTADPKNTSSPNATTNPSDPSNPNGTVGPKATPSPNVTTNSKDVSNSTKTDKSDKLSKSKKKSKKTSKDRTSSNSKDKKSKKSGNSNKSDRLDKSKKSNTTSNYGDSEQNGNKAKSSKSGKWNLPKTGEGVYIYGCIAIALLSGVLIFVLLKRRKKHNKWTCV